MAIRYIIERKLGEGDIGITYLAKNRRGELRVIKTLREQILNHPALPHKGEAQFNIYTGTVSLDIQEFDISVIVGDKFAEVFLGLPWLFTKKLVVDFPEGLLTLG